jgi:uncharacterized protein (DUF2141 family)
MGKKITFVTWLFFLSVLTFGERNRQKTCDLTVRIDNIKKVTGEMQLGLYNNAEDFPKKDKQYRLVIRKVEGKVFTYTFHDLPAGEYALAVFHDKDTNGKIKKNLLGIPTEPYGFSNNIKPKLSAPPFEKTKFLLASDTTVSITLFH